MFLEMKFFDFLPAGHYACAAAKTHVAPHGVQVAVVDYADVVCLVGESC